MNMWECLEIEKTKDMKQIKNAYVKQLRIHRPEEDPYGFQMLKIAYDFAQKFAQIEESTDSNIEEVLLEISFVKYWKQNSPDYNGKQDDGESIADILSGFQDSENKTTNSNVSKSPSPDTAALDNYIDQMQTLYNDFFARRSSANWEKLIDSDMIWNIQSKEKLDPKIQQFLMTHRNLPPGIWGILDDEFHWSERIKELSQKAPIFAKVVLIETCKKWLLDYSFVTEDATYDFEKYIEYLRLTREAVLENNEDGVGENYLKAINIYDQEPQIHIIAVDFFSCQSLFSILGQFKTVYQNALDKLIELHVNDKLYLLVRAELNMRCEDLDLAKEDYLNAMDVIPDNLNIPLKIADIYQRQRMNRDVKFCMKYIRKTYPEAQKNLEKQLLLAEDKEQIRTLMETNERIVRQVNDALKFHFDLRQHGRILFYIYVAAMFIIIFILLAQSQHS